MGGSISSSMAESMEKTQGKMMEKQKAMQFQMRDLQMAMGIARSRDNFYWQAGLYGVLLTGFTASTVRNKAVPQALIPPVIGMGYALVFNYDLSFGSKMIRVRENAQRILLDEPHMVRFPIHPGDLPRSSRGILDATDQEELGDALISAGHTSSWYWGSHGKLGAEEGGDENKAEVVEEDPKKE